MPALSTARISVNHYLALGEDPAGLHLELVDGELEVSPNPNRDHSSIDTVLRSILYQHVFEHDLGEVFGDVDTILDEYNVRRPDIQFFRKDKARQLVDKGQRIMPDLAVEILSPSSVTTDLERKFDQYQQAGIDHYWIVNPQDRTLIGWRLEGPGYVESDRANDEQTLSLPPCPDLAIPLARLWRS